MRVGVLNIDTNPEMTIVFESEAEMICFYHRMNMGSHKVIESYSRNHHRVPINTSEGSSELFNKIANVLSAKRIKPYEDVGEKLTLARIGEDNTW